MFGSDVAKQRALIVDDSEVLRRLIDMCLRPAGFETASAANGAEAIESAVSYEPDLIILDIGLPDMTGWEVLARLRALEAGANAKIMMLSGYEEVQIEARDRGADAALVKPFRNEELRDLAVDLIGLHLEGASTPA